MGLNFLRLGTTFDPEDLVLMGQAFEMACERLSVRRGREREEVAAEIFAVASRGDCDPHRLCAVVVQAFQARPGWSSCHSSVGSSEPSLAAGNAGTEVSRPGTGSGPVRAGEMSS